MESHQEETKIPLLPQTILQTESDISNPAEVLPSESALDENAFPSISVNKNSNKHNLLTNNISQNIEKKIHKSKVLHTSFDGKASRFLNSPE